jgi:hypothetical protein
MLMRTSIRFTSLVCAQGYELVLPRDDPLYAHAALLLGLQPLAAPPPREWLTVLAPKGPERRASAPLQFESLFRFFADQPYDPEAYRLFSNRWGLLSVAPAVDRLEPERGRGRRDGSPSRRAVAGRPNASLEKAAALLKYWPDASSRPRIESQSTMAMAAFHSLIRCALGLPTDAEPPCVQEYRATTMPRLAGLPSADSVMRDHAISQLAGIIERGAKVMMETDPTADLPILVIRPANLMTAISLQALKHVSGIDDRDGVKFVQCKQCSAYLKVGPGTGRRSTSEFCTRKCQDRHSYLARKQKNEAQR